MFRYGGVRPREASSKYAFPARRLPPSTPAGGEEG